MLSLSILYNSILKPNSYWKNNNRPFTNSLKFKWPIKNKIESIKQNISFDLVITEKVVIWILKNQLVCKKEVFFYCQMDSEKKMEAWCISRKKQNESNFSFSFNQSANEGFYSTHAINYWKELNEHQILIWSGDRSCEHRILLCCILTVLKEHWCETAVILYAGRVMGYKIKINVGNKSIVTEPKMPPIPMHWLTTYSALKVFKSIFIHLFILQCT